MIKEPRVTLKTAKLLKEWGFEERCNAYYINNASKPREDYDNFNWNSKRHSTKDYQYTSAPTQTVVTKWLRDKYSILIVVSLDKDTNMFEATVYLYSSSNQWAKLYIEPNHKCLTYEKILEKAIYHTIKDVLPNLTSSIGHNGCIII